MATEIVLLDGTKIRLPDPINKVLEMIGPPVPGWVYINEGDDAPKRHFNPANVAYVIEVAEPHGPFAISV
jgi:hypothetical protein